MALDLEMSVLVTRTLLALPDLEINDFADYYVSSTFLGGNETLQRTKITSPFALGDTTTQYVLGSVNETVVVEVLADTRAELQTLENALKAALRQAKFTMTVTFDGAGAQYVYQMEAADVQRAWTGPREAAVQGQLTFAIPRQPDVVLL